MQIIKSLLKITLFVLPISAFSQATYLNQGSREYHFLERLEILHQRNPDLNFSGIKPFNRKFIVQQAEQSDSVIRSEADKYNLQQLLMANSEWVKGDKSSFLSKKDFLNTFYKTKANFFEVDNKDFFMAINPMLNLHGGGESEDGSQQLFINSRGVTVRGLIAGKVGFSSTLIENQERGPRYFQREVKAYDAVPGVGFYKPFKNNPAVVDYFDARGYITFNAAKFIDFQFGYDKNFIGHGYRSLFLSDWGNSYLFGKINTRIWKFNYQNIFMELMPEFHKPGRDTLIDRKYAAMHHLSMNVTKWLNIGLFESVVFGRRNRFDFQYLNPIIFYRHIEGTVGSPDNAFAGFDFKANVAKKFQFYGQFLLDEFLISKLRNDPKNWVNKYGIQLGAKYINAFGIQNLDLQAELNRVRPFTYAHYDSVSNYTHYNQPLAHPLGANFQEFVGILQYQPHPKWNIYARAMYYYKGLDSTGVNNGGNIFRDYTTRTAETGFAVGGGNKATCFNGMLNLSYEFKHNLFFELMMQYRRFRLSGVNSENNQSTLVSAGVRWNIFRRTYDF